MGQIIQESLFEEFEDEVLTTDNVFCIKSCENPNTSIEISVQPDQEPEAAALNTLGYFLVSKRTYV